MSRIRTIKPEFFTSEDIVDLPPLARIFYIGLWCEADREGRLVWKPRTLKMRYLPEDQCDIEELAQNLVDAGLVVVYGGGTYAHIPKFSQHQVIPHREAVSKLPAPSDELQGNCSADAVQLPGKCSDITGGKGREGKGSKPMSENSDEEVKKGGFDYPAEFLEFWKAYPRKDSKADCLKTWKRKKLGLHLPTILADIARRKGGDDWQKSGGQFIPMPATYLNQDRWADSEPPSPAADSGGGQCRDPFEYIGPEACAAIRLAGGPGFANTIRERQQVESKAKELGWKG